MLELMTTNEPPAGPGPDQPDDSSTTPPPPGGDASYPPPPTGPADTPGGGYPPPPPPPSDSGFEAPFDAPTAISYGWTKFRANAGQWLLAGLAIFVVIIAFSFLSVVSQPEVSPTETNPFAAFSLGSVVVNLLSTIVGYVITGIVYRGALDETEGRPFSFGDAMSRVPIVPVIITALLVGIGVTVGMFLCVIPGLVFAFFSYFALLFVVDRDESPVDAIKSSFSLVAANAGQALLLALLCFVIVLLGACLCGLGLFVAYPVVSIATAYAYKRFQHLPTA